MAVLFLAFVFGLVIGSFLNVLIYRLPYKKSFLGRSSCLWCHKRINWSDNIPVISFLFLKGRCRKCRAKISWQYPTVELLAGFLFLISFLIYGSSPVILIYILFLISLLTVIGFIDLRNFIILDNLILTGFIGSFILIFLFYVSCFKFQETVSCSFNNSLLGMLFFAGIFLFLFLASKGKWLGFGDVKFAALLGFVFGLEDSIDIFYLTFLIGFFIAIILLVLKRADLKTQVPLGSIMGAASILFLLTGFSVLDLINSELILRLWLRN